MQTVELDCRRVRTFRELAEWAIRAFHLPVAIDDLPTTSVQGLLLTHREVDMDHLTRQLFSHIGKSGISYSVRLKHYGSASQDLLRVLNHPDGWRRAFGSGLPHDYGVCVGFEP